MKIQIKIASGEIIPTVFDSNSVKLSEKKIEWLQDNTDLCYGGIDARNMMTEGRLLWDDVQGIIFTVIKNKFVYREGKKWLQAEDISIDDLYYEVVPYKKKGRTMICSKHKIKDDNCDICKVEMKITNHKESEFVKVKRNDLKNYKHWIKSYSDECNINLDKELKSLDKYLGEKGGN